MTSLVRHRSLPRGARALAAALTLAGAPLAGAPLAAQTSRAAPAAFTPAWREFAAQFHRRMDEEGVVGGSIWFAHGGTVLGKEVHGFADLETQRRVDENTIYHWASNTKTFTGIAIMQLRDRGRLTLDDPVVRYLPELRAVHNPFGSMEAITIRHLMSHSSGFRSPTWPWGGDKPWHPHEPTQWAQLVAMLPYTEVEFVPGSRYKYSNPGIVFLGMIVEQLSGDDYEVYVDKNILKPLGMHRTYFDVTPYHLLRHRSNNYTVTDGRPVANGLDFDTGITTSNGGLNAPIPDMVRYVSFLAGSGDTTLYAEVLRRSSLEEMWRTVVPVQPTDAGGTPAADAWKTSLGLTFFLFERGDTKMIGHTGGQKSFVTYLYVDPVSRATAIGAFNTTGNPKPNMRNVIDRAQLFDRIFPLFRGPRMNAGGE
ncbi:MAG: serine hydrolase domain-containing protein [Gemmatimonadaceae bacterium]